MSDIRKDLLLSLLDHVIFDTDTGCWILIETCEELQIDFRYLAWGLWYDSAGPLHVYLDYPWCANGQYGLCVNPVHGTAIGVTYTRRSILDVLGAVA